MFQNLMKSKAMRDLLQTVILPFAVGIIFLFWVYALIVSHQERLVVFPLSILMLITMYFFSGAIYAGVLLGFITTVSFMMIVIASGVMTRLVLFLETLWLWSVFAVFEFYKIYRQRYQNRKIVEDEIINADIDILKNKIEDEKKHYSDLRQRLSNYNYLEEMTIPLSSTMQEERIVSLVTDLSAKFIGRGEWNIVKGIHNDVFSAYINRYKVPLLIQDVRLDNRFSIEKTDTHSLIAVPLEVSDEFWGILKGTSKNENVFDEGDLRLLSILGGISSLALTNAQLYRRTQELAITDGLTGLYVQSYFKERLAQEFVRSRRYKLPLTIAMLDIDHFKNVNDTFGHNVGDEVLKHVSSTINNRLRDTDFLSRYGGEEFAVIMLQTTTKEAHKVAEDIRKNVQKEIFSILNENAHKIEMELTISIGIASLDETVKNYEDLIRIADEALYKAKNCGRNRCEVSEINNDR